MPFPAPPVWYHSATDRALPRKLLQRHKFSTISRQDLVLGPWICNAIQRKYKSHQKCLHIEYMKNKASLQFQTILFLSNPQSSSPGQVFIGITQTSADHYVFLLHIPKFNFAYHDITIGCYGNCYTTTSTRFFYHWSILADCLLLSVRVIREIINVYSPIILKMLLYNKNLLVSDYMLGFKHV